MEKVITLRSGKDISFTKDEVSSLQLLKYRSREIKYQIRLLLKNGTKFTLVICVEKLYSRLKKLFLDLEAFIYQSNKNYFLI